MVEAHESGALAGTSSNSLPAAVQSDVPRTAVGALLTHFSELVRHPAFRARPLTTLGRAVAWAGHCLRGVPVEVTFRDPDFRLTVPAAWPGGGGTAAFVLREDYSPEYRLLSACFKPGMVVIDAGANAGAFTMSASRRVGPTGRVVAFEPGPTCFALLQRSKELNGCTNVSLRSEALTETCGTATLFLHDGRDNSFGLGRSGELGVRSLDIVTTTVARVYGEEGLSRLDVLKLDVEGAQELVIRGGLDLIRRHRPLVAIFIDHAATRRLGLDPKGAFDVLGSLGYRYYAVVAGSPLVPTAQPEAQTHVMCVPPGWSSAPVPAPPLERSPE